MAIDLDHREYRRERAREDTRDDIVAAAWRLAERDGLAGLSLRDLAAEVGMRAPSLYTYFGSKDAIYDAMFTRGYDALDAELTEALAEAAGRDTADALTHTITRWLAFCQASVPRYQLLFTNTLPGWTPSAEAYAASQRSYAQMAEALAGFGVEGQRTLDLYTALTAGLAAQQLANDPGGDRWTQLIPEAMAMFVTHLERQAQR